LGISLKKKALPGILILILGVGLYFSIPLWLTELGDFLILKEPLSKTDILVVLSGDEEGQRLRYAFHLYQKGYAPKILLSGATNLWEETGIDLMEKYLVQLGVSPKDIFSERHSESTAENATYSRCFMEERGLKSAIVVTSPTHTRRVSIIFKKTFPSQITVSVASDPGAFQPKGWWRDLRDRRAVIREYFQIGWYLLFGD
jgi:uncharacterized SAM-binding protein YcdF (DUF218 family)